MKTTPSLEKLRILIVEDQMEARTMLRSMLGTIGITQVFEAKDGRKALSFMDDAMDMIDLVICDWNMPEMDGVELLRQLRSVDSTTPFLMITGRCDKDSVSEAINGGVSGYIRKPFSPDPLEVKLRVMATRIANTR